MKKIAGLFICLFAGSANAGLITKNPDLGPYWSPFSSQGTYVYANSFVADANATVTDLGTWLYLGGSDFVLQVYGSVGGNAANGPDTANVLATTSVASGLSFESLTYFELPTLAGGTALVNGQTYWFGASAVGLGGSGSFTFGSHTQNTGGINDNGTFWYSNDVNGFSFDGQHQTPEIAFTVNIGPSTVPEPMSLALLGLGIAGLGFSRKKKAA